MTAQFFHEMAQRCRNLARGKVSCEAKQQLDVWEEEFVVRAEAAEIAARAIERQP
jgi:hypothetical protein